MKPYGANSLVSIQVQEVQTWHNGQIQGPVILRHSQQEAGINHLTAAFDNHFGAKGPASQPVIIELLQ